MKQLLYQFIYYPPVNRLLRTIIRITGLGKRYQLPPSGHLKIKLRSEKTLILETNQTSQLTRILYWSGYQNFEYTTIFEELISNISLFYDIGANIGYYSLIAGIENKNIRVVGFEPAESPFHFFQNNIRLNRLPNVKAESLAIANKAGEIEFYEIKNDKYTYLQHNLAGESNVGSKTTGRNYQKTTVQSITLDEYVALHEKENIDLIKLDTEGSEASILNHAHNVLSQMKPIVICETLFNTIEADLESLFKEHGYLFFNHTSRGLKQVDTIIRSKDDGVRNCFFVHPEKINLVRKFIY